MSQNSQPLRDRRIFFTAFADTQKNMTQFDHRREINLNELLLCFGLDKRAALFRACYSFPPSPFFQPPFGMTQAPPSFFSRANIGHSCQICSTLTSSPPLTHVFFLFIPPHSQSTFPPSVQHSTTSRHVKQKTLLSFPPVRRSAWMESQFSIKHPQCGTRIPSASLSV